MGLIPGFVTGGLDAKILLVGLDWDGVTYFKGK